MSQVQPAKAPLRGHSLNDAPAFSTRNVGALEREAS
jgi:hypothetical protein